MADILAATLRPDPCGRLLPAVRALLAASLLLSTCLAARPEYALAAPYRWVEGDVVVKFRPGVRSTVTLEELGVIEAEPLGSTGIDRLRISGLTTEQAVQRLKARPDVEYAEPNWIIESAAVPNDSLFAQQWALRNTGQTGGTPGADINAVAAWDLATGSNDVRVGVIDSGMDLTHPELAPNLFANPGEIPGNLIDDDGNGFVDDVHGWDFVEGDADPSDPYGHGTMAAGIIGAAGNDWRGVAGVCWRVGLIPIRIINAQGVGDLTSAIKAVDYATRMNVRLTSNSWGRLPESPALSDAIRAAGERGILFVCAAGNGGIDNDAVPHFPSSFPHDNIVAVAATDALDELPRFSNYGATSVDLAAPGEAILSTFPGGGWFTLTGTSFSTPFAAGALALAFARAPRLSGPAARTSLLQNVKPLPSLAGRMVSGGRLDLMRFIAALDVAAPPPVTDLAAADVNGTGLTLTWTAGSDDDGASPLSGYEVRYSLEPIDETSFDGATPVAFAGTPAAPGQIERLQVSGLAFDTIYYFALRAVDEHGNRSAISNVTTVRTLPPPRAHIVAESLDFVLGQGETAERTLTIENLGPSPLDFDLEAQAVLDRDGAESATLMRGTGTHTPMPGAELGVPLRRRDATSTNAGGDRFRSPGAPVGWRVLVIAQTTDAQSLDSALTTAPELSTVDVVRLDERFPTLEELFGYDAVILVATTRFGTRTELGDLLADYADAGGGVVLTQGAFNAPSGIAGRLQSGGYLPFDLGPADLDGAALGTPDTDHPLLQGVRGLISYPVNLLPVADGAELIARWSNLRPCIATRRGVVGINVAFALRVGWGGDGVRLLVNAVRWSARRPTWIAFDTERGSVPPGQTAHVRITASALRVEPDRLARIVVRTNDPAALTTTLPVRRTVLSMPRAELDGGIVRLGVDETIIGTANPTPTLIAPTPRGVLGLVELGAVGRFANGNIGTRLYIEGTRVGSIGLVTILCGSLHRAFEIPQALLASALADGRLNLLIEPTSFQAQGCAARYSVALTYVARADTLEFTPRYQGLPDSLPLVLRNTGGAPLQLNEVRSSHPDIQVAVASSTILPGGTLDLQVHYSAATAGVQSGVITLFTNDPDRPEITVAVRGVALGRPILALDATEIFHRVFAGETDTVRIGLANPGSATATFEIVPQFETPWLTVTPNAGTVAPGARTEIALELNTSGLPATFLNAVLRVLSNDPHAPEQSLSVLIEVVARPYLTLGGVPVLRESSLPYDAAGPCVSTHAFRLDPPPAGPITVDIVALGDFSTQASGLSFSLEDLEFGQTAAGELPCAPLWHSFRPSPGLLERAGADSILEITVSHEASTIACDRTRHDVALRYSPVLTVLDAGNVPIGGRGRCVLLAHNSGDGTLTGRAFVTGSPSFQPPDTIRVEGRSTGTIEVGFAPSAEGEATATLVLETNDPTHPRLELPLRGRGVAPPIVVIESPAATTIDAGDAASAVVRIRNEGGSPLEYAARTVAWRHPVETSVTALGASQDPVSGPASGRPRRMLDSAGQGPAPTQPDSSEMAGLVWGWAELLPRPPDGIVAVAADPVDGVLYARTQELLYRYRPGTRVWQLLAQPPANGSPRATCDIAGRRLYSVSTGLITVVDVYDIATDTWTRQPYVGFSSFATDGMNALYALGPAGLVRIDLTTGERVELALPPLGYFLGAMSYLDGALFVRIDGYDTALRYDIDSDTWTQLPPLFGFGTSGTVDPERGEFVIYSGFGIWRWVVSRSSWEQEPFGMFYPGHVAWLPGQSGGLFVLGALSGPRMARLHRRPMLDLEPSRGTVPPGGEADVVLNLRAASLRPGEHRIENVIETNAPGHSIVTTSWPLTLRPTTRGVIGGVVVTGSLAEWTPSTHYLDMRATPAGNGTLEMVVDGYSGNVTATVALEGSPLFTVARPRNCGPVAHAGVVPRDELSRLAELGSATGTVTLTDGNYCGAPPHHLLVVRYPSATLPHDFGSVAVGDSASVRMRVANTGSAFLVGVRATSNRPEIGSNEIFALYPDGDDVLTITWKPSTVGPFSATVSIVSEQGVVAQGTVTGIGLPPPRAVLEPKSLSVALTPGGHVERPLTIRNTGGAPLRWRARAARTGSPSVAPSSGASIAHGAASVPSLEQVLFNLDERAGHIVAPIPDRFDFLEGVVGYMIEDGGENMYDFGNMIYSAGPIGYSDGVIQDAPYPTHAVRYFTRKHPGLFVLAADVPAATGITVTGTLGNQGSAVVDRSHLVLRRPEGDFAGFVKRVHGGTTPSVNHLFLVTYDDAQHFVLEDPRLDHDQLENIPPDGRVYYLLFASRAGGYVSDSVMTEIATRFLDAIQATPWLSVSPQEGVVPAGESQTLSVLLDASSLAEGLHRGLVTIESNDVIAPRIELPVSLQVGNAVQVGLRVQPRTLNLHSQGNWITGCVVLPPPLTRRDVARGSARLNGVEADGWPRIDDHMAGSSGAASAQTIDEEPGTEGGLADDVDGQGHADDDDRDDDDGGGHDDGHDDETPHVLTLKFDRTAVVRTLPPGERAELTLTATLSDGRAVEGRDTVRVISPGRRAPSLATDGEVFELALGGAVPNPFGAATRIDFALPRPGPARLEVFDLAGRRVRTLADGSREPGRYSIPWDGTDAEGHRLAAGVYVLRLEAAGGVLTRRVVRLAR